MAGLESDMTSERFEDRLVQALQPIRGLATGHALHAMWECGVYAALWHQPGQSTPQLAKALSLEPDRLDGLLNFLAHEGYSERIAEQWHLCDAARQIAEFRPWFTLLIGGYARTFDGLPAALRAGAPWAQRDSDMVGRGSCGMSLIDIRPAAERLLQRLGDNQSTLTIVDVGCGDAAFLCEILRGRPNARGIGFDVSNVEETAVDNILNAGLTGRIDVRSGDLNDVAELKLPDTATTCVMCSFLLQEVLQQKGENELIDLMTRVVTAHPAARWLVFEIDTSAADFSHPLARAYYSPYFLLHAVTEQRLAPESYWLSVFERVGLELVDKAYPDPEVDSTQIEVGYLLAPRGNR